MPRPQWCRLTDVSGTGAPRFQTPFSMGQSWSAEPFTGLSGQRLDSRPFHEPLWGRSLPKNSQNSTAISQTTTYDKDEFVLLTKMDLSEFTSYTLKGVGLGGLAASDGVGWVIVLDGQPQSGHGSTSHAAMHLKDRGHLIIAACTATHSKP